MVCFAVALSVAASVARAQDASVPKIPPTLPLATRNMLDGVRGPLLARVSDHNKKVADFNSRCAQLRSTDAAPLIAACRTENGVLVAEERSVIAEKQRFAAQIDSAVAAAATCATIATQLESDKEALRRQQKTNEMGVAQIDEWRKLNEKALEEAATHGATAVLGSAARSLEQRQNSANTFAGLLTKYENKMRGQDIPYAALEDKINRAAQGYLNARTEALGGVGLGKALEARDYFDNFKIQAGLVARDAEDADGNLKAALRDTTFQKFVKADATDWELLRSTLDLATSLPEFKKIVPQYQLAAFVVDEGFDAKKWYESKQRIMQQYNLSDTALAAVAALQHQLERTVQKLKACRAE